MSECRGGPWTSCKFEPRYDLTWSDSVQIETFQGNPDALKNKVYVRDICVKCGKIIERNSE